MENEQVNRIELEAFEEDIFDSYPIVVFVLTVLMFFFVREFVHPFISNLIQ